MPCPVAVIVSGSGRWADPWHSFATTSARLAQILRTADFEVRVEQDVDAQLSDLSGIDLLVLNLGRPEQPHPADEAVRRGLLAHVGHGRPVLALHVSATSLPRVHEWESIMGGAWVPGSTYHPDYGSSRVQTVPGSTLTDGLKDFIVADELYTDLRVHPRVQVLARHLLGGREHPLVWVWAGAGAPVVYDALGHDIASYDSSTHCELLSRAARWLVGMT